MSSKCCMCMYCPCYLLSMDMCSSSMPKKLVIWFILIWRVSGTRNVLSSSCSLWPILGKCVDMFSLRCYTSHCICSSSVHSMLWDVLLSVNRKMSNSQGRISDVSKSLLQGLLIKNPEKRLGGGREDAEEVKRHPFYASINWQEVYDRKVSKWFALIRMLHHAFIQLL